MSPQAGGRPALIARRSGAWGLVASGLLALFYVLVVRLASGSGEHLVDQIRRDWYLLVAILAGFGIQVACIVELRRRHRLGHAALAAGGTGSGASALGMVACCAHHLADLLPVLGATGAAAFLLDWRVPFMVDGIAINALGVAASVRRLRRISTEPTRRSHRAGERASCAAA